MPRDASSRTRELLLGALNAAVRRPGEHAGLVAGVIGWAGSDRTLLDVVGKFGPPSVVFGPADPGLPKTLGYATRERTEPFVTFHLGAAAQEAALLAVRVDDGFLDGWALTPWGVSRFG